MERPPKVTREALQAEERLERLKQLHMVAAQVAIDMTENFKPIECTHIAAMILATVFANGVDLDKVRFQADIDTGIAEAVEAGLPLYRSACANIIQARLAFEKARQS